MRSKGYKTMSQRKKQIRELFRNSVFRRDGCQCRVCGNGDGYVLDAHHIIDRNELPNGGYVVENGISLCL
jgi:5-methylcytosine-specific restriction endonuclease McrA